MSDDDDDLDGDEDNCTACHYCHYNDSKDIAFSISVLGHDMILIQKPDSIDLGIGAVVWDSSVIFAKYVEVNRNNKFPFNKMAGKTVLELGKRSTS